MRRISIRNKQFVEISDMGEFPVSNPDDSTAYDAVIVNAATISRAYYAGEYEPDKPTLPTCWSSDTQTPDIGVPQGQRQAARCLDCQNNIRGSGRGSSRACRFSQRLAVLPHDRLEEVFQLHIPATSIFGGIENGHMHMREYAHHLQNRGVSFGAVITRIYFDMGSDIPKLCFKPMRPLRDEELSVVSDRVFHPDTIRAITLEYTPFEGNTTSPFEVTDGFEINN